MALYSLYVVLKKVAANKSLLLEPFPLSLTAFWFFYFVRLFYDHFVLGVVTFLPIWEFLAWGVGGCFLPSLACYSLAARFERRDCSLSVLSLGFLLLGSSTLFFILSAGINLQQRFQLPDLNPINVSHSFFVLSLVALSCLAYSYHSKVRSLCVAGVCAFGVFMGIYSGSRGAFLAFICSFMVVFLASRFNKLWSLVPLIFSVFLLAQFDPSDLVGRLIVAGSDQNSLSRISAIQESISVFLSHPLVGYGFGFHSNLLASASVWYPHNFISESLALGGLLLTIPLLICVLLSIRPCQILFSKPSISDLWRIAILLQAFGYVMFSGHLGNVPMFWISLGLVSSIPRTHPRAIQS